MSWLSRLETKAADDFTPADAHLHRGLSRTRYNYGRDVQQGLESNVVMAPIHWITRNFTEAVPLIQKRTQKRIWGDVEDHAVEGLLRRPNPFYSGTMLWKAVLLSMMLDGNGYWRKIRNGFGDVLELWYLPHFLVEPRFPRDGSVFVSHYDYTPFPGGQKVEIPVRNIVHFRFGGLDPENTRKGLSPVRPLLREVFTDEEASNFAASILRNMGVPGGVIAPKDTAAAQALSDEEALAMKDYMKGQFTGDRRGEWFASGIPIDIAQFGFDPNQLMLGNLRDIAEERVCAMLGISAAVVGFGSGLQSTKVGATMRELRQAAWHNCIIPLQNDVSEQASMQILPDFVSDVKRHRISFDRSQVSAFEEDKTEKARRVGILTEHGVITVAKGQELAGVDPDPSQNVYLRKNNLVAVKEGDAGLTPPKPAASDDEVPPAVAARMNGNGQPSDEG